VLRVAFELEQEFSKEGKSHNNEEHFVTYCDEYEAGTTIVPVHRESLATCKG